MPQDHIKSNIQNIKQLITNWLKHDAVILIVRLDMINHL